MVRKAVRNSWRFAMRRVLPAEVVKGNEQRHCVPEVIDFLAVAKCQPRQTPIKQAEAEVCPFNVRSVDEFRVWIANLGRAR
jgi:hypothetical protein